MRNSIITTEYLAYHLDLNPITAAVPRKTWQTLTISGTVKGVDYQDARMGSYSDTVVVSIEP
jgi:hypothetical protein